MKHPFRCCFTCTHWNNMRGRRKGKAYCFKWRLSGKDAPYGDHVCVDWEKRANARVPKTEETVSQ
jgi:hypothetical protein